MIPPLLTTTAGVAATLAVTVDGVLALIAAGTLRAVDVRRPGSTRPRWRVTPKAMDAFLAARGNRPAATTTRRRKRMTDVIEFF